jgi:hypothetical protein
VDIKSAVKEVLGEAPVPPASAHNGVGGAQQNGGSEKMEGMVGGVKRAVVRARVGAAEAGKERERSERRMEQVLAGAEVPVYVRVEALERARSELVAWIEGELGKVRQDEEDGEEEDDRNGGESSLGDINGDGEMHEQDISLDIVNARVQEMYDRYIEARRTVLSAVEAALSDHKQQQEPQQTRPSTTSAGNSAPSSPRHRRHNSQHHRHQSSSSTTGPSLSALTLLPHLPHLISSGRTNAALLTQTSYLRRSLAQSSSAAATTLQRLAGESHLVGPDADSLAVWAQASREADAVTREAVGEQVESGKRSVERAGMELAEWRARREAIERVKGGSAG